MAKGAYIGEANLTRKIKKMYLGADSTAHKVKKGYIGVSGQAKMFYTSDIDGIKMLQYMAKIVNIILNIICTVWTMRGFIIGENILRRMDYLYQLQIMLQGIIYLPDTVVIISDQLKVAQ